MYNLPQFCWNVFENDKIMLFRPRQPPFRIVSNVVCWRLWKERVCWRRDEDEHFEMSELLLQMLDVTAVGSHKHKQLRGLVKFANAVFLWQFFLDGLHGDFQLITHLSVFLVYIALLLSIL